MPEAMEKSFTEKGPYKINKKEIIALNKHYLVLVCFYSTDSGFNGLYYGYVSGVDFKKGGRGLFLQYKCMHESCWSTEKESLV